MNNKTEIPLAKKETPIEQDTRYWFEIHFYSEQNTLGLAFILWNGLLCKQSIKQEFPLVNG